MNNEETRLLFSLIEKNSQNIQRVLDEQKLQRQIIIGNGESDNSIIARLQRLEMKSSTLGFMVDKLIAPVIASVVTAGLILALS